MTAPTGEMVGASAMLLNADRKASVLHSRSFCVKDEPPDDGPQEQANSIENTQTVLIIVSLRSELTCLLERQGEVCSFVSYQFLR